MKLCPNCGAENQDNALKCVLCEFEFEEECVDNIVHTTAADVIKSDNIETLFESNKIGTSKDEENNVAKAISGKSDFVSSSASKGLPKAIIAIASVLIVGGGIAGGMFFMKKQNAKLDDPLNAAESSTQSTTLITPASVTTSTSNSVTTGNISTVNTTETVTTVTAEQATKPVIDQNAVKDAYIRRLTEFTKSDEFNAYDYPSKYALFDIDGDGVDELFIQYMAIVGSSEKLYSYKNNEYTEIAHCSESSFSIEPNNHLIQWYIGGGGTARYIAALSEQGITTEEIGLVYPASYTHNKVGISKEEYDELNRKYDAYNWVKPSYNAFSSILPDSVVYAKPRETYAFLGAVNITSDVLNVREGPSTNSKVIGSLSRGDLVSVYKLDGYPDWYKIVFSEKNLKGYASAQYIVEADTFKDNNNTYSEYTDESMLISKGKTKLNEGGVLNVRKSPSTDAEIITTIPKDHYVGIISVSGDWYYVKYYADTNSPIYYGYVSSQFIEIT